MYQYSYLVGDLILALVWIIFFILRRDLRKQQFIVSLFASLFWPIADWLYRDYWNPISVFSINISGVTVRLESLFFSFFGAGIAAVLYEVIFRKKHLFGKDRPRVSVIIILSTVILAIFLNILGLNSIWASSLSMLVSSLIMISIDKDLLKDAIGSSLFLPILFILFYFLWLNIYPEGVQRFWLPSAMSGVVLWKIPIEEIVWFISAGMFGGIIYEFWLNVKSYPKLNASKKIKH